MRINVFPLPLAFMQVRARVAAVAAPQMLPNFDCGHVHAEALNESRQVEHLAVMAAPTDRDESHPLLRQFAKCPIAVPHGLDVHATGKLLV